MRGTLVGLVRGFLGALSAWCMVLGLVLAAIVVTALSFAAGWCYSEHRRSREALDAAIAQLAARGEVVGIASQSIETASADNRLAHAAEKLRILARDLAIGRKWPKCRELLGAKSARVGWRSETPPSQHGDLTWDEVTIQLRLAAEPLGEVRSILASDDTVAAMPVSESDDRAIVPWLAWSAMERLHSLDPEGAVRDITVIRRLAERHGRVATLDSQLWMCSLLKSGIRLSWEALQAPGLTETTLDQLSALWIDDAPLTGVSATLRRERSVGVSGFAALVRSMETDANWKGKLEDLGFALTGRSNAVGWIGEAGAWLRYGAWRILWADEELACFLNAIQLVIDHIENEAGDSSWAGIRDAWAAAEKRLAGRPGRMGLDRLVVGAGGLNGGRVACQVILEFEAERRMLLTDIARSRFELDHGETPNSVGQLVPAYLPSAPVDPMDGRPIRYRLGAMGEPVIYSVGPDCRDDNGNTERPDMAQATAISHCRDMVWPLADFPRSIE